MNFQGTDRKVREMNQHFNSLLKSENTDEFEGNFNAFVSASISVVYSLETEAGVSLNKSGYIVKKGNVMGFSDWYDKKIKEIRNDELCKFFKKTRNKDIHASKSALQSMYTIVGGTVLEHTGDYSLEIGPRGTYEVYEKGTPKERRIQRKLQTEEEFEISLINAPTKHLGNAIKKADPINLCKIYKTYLENLVLEAKEKFLAL